MERWGGEGGRGIRGEKRGGKEEGGGEGEREEKGKGKGKNYPGIAKAM